LIFKEKLIQPALVEVIIGYFDEAEEKGKNSKDKDAESEFESIPFRLLS